MFPIYNYLVCDIRNVNASIVFRFLKVLEQNVKSSEKLRFIPRPDYITCYILWEENDWNHR